MGPAAISRPSSGRPSPASRSSSAPRESRRPAATIEAFRSRGHDLVPGTGVEAACVPGSFGGWLLLLEQFGTWGLDEVLAYAIGYAEHGYPVPAGVTATIERAEPLLRELGRIRRALSAGAAARLDVPQPPARGDLAPPARRIRTERSRARGASTTRASSPRRSTASRGSTTASSPERTWPRGARRSNRR